MTWWITNILANDVEYIYVFFWMTKRLWKECQYKQRFTPSSQQPYSLLMITRTCEILSMNYILSSHLIIFFLCCNLWALHYWCFKVYKWWRKQSKWMQTMNILLKIGSSINVGTRSLASWMVSFYLYTQIALFSRVFLQGAHGWMCLTSW
jgi:hypothetical protein